MNATEDAHFKATRERLSAAIDQHPGFNLQGFCTLWFSAAGAQRLQAVELLVSLPTDLQSALLAMSADQHRARVMEMASVDAEVRQALQLVCPAGEQPGEHTDPRDVARQMRALVGLFVGASGPLEVR